MHCPYAGSADANSFLEYWQANVTQLASDQLGMQVYPVKNGVNVEGNYNGTASELQAALDAAGLGASSPYTILNYKVSSTSWLQDLVDGACE